MIISGSSTFTSEANPHASARIDAAQIARASSSSGASKLGRRPKPSAAAALDGALAHGLLEAAGCVDDVGRPVRVERDVTEVPGAPEVAAKKAAVDDRGSADARAKCQQDRVQAPSAAPCQTSPTSAACASLIT